MSGSLPQPHPRPAAVFGDELDAGRFEGGVDGSYRIRVRRRALVLKSGHRSANDAAAGCSDKFVLAPSKQTSGGSALCGGNHHGSK